MSDISSDRSLDDHEVAVKLQRFESGLRTRAKVPKKRKIGKKRGGGGFQKPCQLSEPLQAVVGKSEVKPPRNSLF